jgi:hypothetical protein
VLTPVGYNRFRLANTEFVSAMKAEGSTPSSFLVHLGPGVIEGFGGLRAKLHFHRVLQVTRDESAVAALTLLVGAPSKLVAVSSASDEPVALWEFARRRGCTEVLRTIGGVEPGDSARWHAITAEEFPGRSLDVVLDDGSNWLDVAGPLFDALFPALGAGGSYLILGWTAIHRMFEKFAARADWTDEESAAARARMLDERGRSVEALLPRLIDANRRRPEVVAGVEVGPNWIEVVRGPADVDVDAFALADLVGD